MSQSAKKKKSYFARSGLRFLISSGTYMHVRIDRSMDATPVASSFIPPSAIHELHTPFAYADIPGAHGTAHMKLELLPKNESDVKPRPDWFTSEGHFAPDSRSTCRIYARKSPRVSLARNPCVYSFFSTAFLLASERSPRYPTSSRALELQHS